MIQDKIFFDEKDPTGLSYNTPFTFYGSYQGRLYSKTPTGSIKYYTQNSDLSAYATTGSNQFSGSQTVTGSLTVTGTITGTVAGTTATASYVEYTNVANKPALVSGSSQVTYSGLTGIPSGIVSGSAQIASFGIFATTGSNGFNGSQSITGSLTVTGQVVAQTLNVQQVTSSIVYSSGSNIFGNSLDNTQQFTGSVSITGSLNTSIAAFGSAASLYLVSDGGVIKSRTAAQTLSDIAALPLAGGTLTGALNGTSASFTSSSTLLTLTSNAGTKAVFATTRNFAVNRNFQIAVDEFAESAFTITPSTTLGGSTYTTPIFTLVAAGAATFSDSLYVSKTGAVASIIGLGNHTNGSYGLLQYFGYGTGPGTTLGYHLFYNKQSGTDVVSAAWEIAHEGASADDKAYMAFSTHNGTSLGERMRITSGGDVQIGLSANYSPIVLYLGTATNGSTGQGGQALFGGAEASQDTGHASGTASGSNYHRFIYNGSVIGSITQSGVSAVLYNTSSDYRLKEDLQEIKGLEKIQAIKVYNYKWKAEESRMDGVLAHELAEILPYAVHGKKDEVDEEGNDKMQGVDYSKIVPILIKAMQELSAKIETLEAKIQTLEQQ